MTDIRRLFESLGLNGDGLISGDVFVDPRLCGARLRNYYHHTQFGGRSPVQAAIDEMRQTGIRGSDGLEFT